jgi:putative MFS transporter
MSTTATSKSIILAVIVASLGYCVDVFDVVLFSIYRVQSLTSMGLTPDQVLTSGVHVLNMQLAGMLIGGLIWGVLGDKIGRIQVLFGSILLYSVANIVNSFVHTVEMYSYCRFIAGIGLAGEAGAAVTLVSELMSKTRRGIGTAIVAAAGTSGALFASLAAEFLDWRTAFFVGGIMGLILLVMRISVCESSMFGALKNEKGITKGDIALLFSSRDRFTKYLSTTIAGIPLFFSYYTVIVYSPEVGKALGIDGSLSVARATMVTCIAMTTGDLISGFMSQRFKNRKIVLGSFIALAGISTAILLNLQGASAMMYYITCAMVGLGLGYWAIFLTTGAEQFGTNIRATVASTVPNIVRASPIIMSSIVLMMKDSIGYIASLQLVGTACFILSFLAIGRMKETYGVDLNYVELKDGIRYLQPTEVELQKVA